MTPPSVENLPTNLSLIAQRKAQIQCVDLFCGVGGLTHGLLQRGIAVVAGIDVDPQCRYPYEANNKSSFFEKDLIKVSSEDIEKLFKPKGIRLLAGCAPCQPFSTYSRSSRKNRSDNKWSLVSTFGRLVKEIQPELVTMENVSQLLDHQVFQEFLGCLKHYHIWYSQVDCVDYGVPQARKRLVLLASRLGPIELSATAETATKTHTSVKHAISHLPTLQAGDSDPIDPIHMAASLSELNLRRIQASQPGGTWRDWDVSLLAKCHRKKSGETYPSVYGRMEWEKPAPTITTQCFGYGNGRFGHPEQDRAISLREAAILQTFPEDYKFLAPGEKARFNSLGRLIGNAVPVRLGEVIADCFLKHVAEFSD